MGTLHPNLPAFVGELRHLLDHATSFPGNRIADLLTDMLRTGDFAPHLLSPMPRGYRREVLHDEPGGRFSIGCFVWGPGQQTPIHDHNAWGVIAVAQGALLSETFVLDQGIPSRTGIARLQAGETAWVHPATGDIHRIGAGLPQVCVSVHVYGCSFDTVCRNRYAEEAAALA